MAVLGNVWRNSDFVDFVTFALPDLHLKLFKLIWNTVQRFPKMESNIEWCIIQNPKVFISKTFWFEIQWVSNHLLFHLPWRPVFLSSSIVNQNYSIGLKQPIYWNQLHLNFSKSMQSYRESLARFKIFCNTRCSHSSTNCLVSQVGHSDVI